MRKLTFAIIVLCAAPASASLISGRLSTADGSLLGTGIWAQADPPTYIVWSVEDVGSAWHYTYTVQVTRQSISHFILETSTTFTSSNCWDLSWNGSAVLGLFKANSGNPNMPQNLYGMKFTPTSASGPVTIDFYSDRPPMWGDAYIKAARTHCWACRCRPGT